MHNQCPDCERGIGYWIGYVDEPYRKTPPCVCHACMECSSGRKPKNGIHRSPGSHGRWHEDVCGKLRCFTWKDRPTQEERLVAIEMELGINYKPKGAGK